MKLTDWFSDEIKPSKVGVYEVKSAHGLEGPYYAYWDGCKFGYRYKNSAQLAFENRHEKTGAPVTAVWRGLAEDPNGS